MLWALVMEPNKKYTQVVEKSFHLSMACLDASQTCSGLVQVMMYCDNRNYLLCTLQKGSIWQVPLKLNFQEGTKISFSTIGDGYVHLTGYLIPEDKGLDKLNDFENEVEKEEDDEGIPIVGQKKRKALNSLEKENDLKRAKVDIEQYKNVNKEFDSGYADGELDFEDDSNDESGSKEDADDEYESVEDDKEMDVEEDVNDDNFHYDNADGTFNLDNDSDDPITRILYMHWHMFVVSSFLKI